MKGIIFNLFEDVVTDQLGEAAWDELVDAAQVEGGYTAIGAYSDAEFLQLLRCLPDAETRTMPDTLRWFGLLAMGRLTTIYPGFFEPHTTTTSFLLTLNDIIHPAVRCLYPGADVPVFEFTHVPAADGGGLIVHYRSVRRLCHLAEGFVQGAAAYYLETAVVEQHQCMLDGAPECLMSCTFSSARPRAQH